ncbi:MAG: type II secretion system protein [Acidobacteriota bacterium]
MGRERGFTLIELLVVVAIIGILASIAIPNLLDAIERSKQKKSVAEIRTMVIAMQTFAVDYGGYPNSSYNGEVHLNLINVRDNVGDPVIVPDLIQDLPKGDGWKAPYIYFSGPDGTQPRRGLEGDQVVAVHYCVYSLGLGSTPGGGNDSSADAPDVAVNWCQEPQVIVGVRETHCYESDIVWGDSNFQQSPDGKQRKCG